MRKWKSISIFMMSILLITGCWDKVEIDKRAFVTMMGVDKYEKKEGEEKKESDETKEPSSTARNRYLITIEYANAGLIAGKVQGKPDFLLTSVGESLHDLFNGLSTRTGKKFYYRHTKAVILGEALARDEKLLREVLDTIERSPEIGRKVHLMITQRNEKDILKIAPVEQPVLGLFIRDLMEQNLRTSRIADADLGYILRSLHESRAAIVPGIISSDEEIKIGGSAVLKDFKMTGWLGETDTRNLMFMLDKIKGSLISVKVDDLILPIYITDAKTKMKVYEKDGSLYTYFDVKGEGDLQQHLFEVRDQPLDDKYIKKVEKAIAKHLEEEMTSTYKKIQKDFEADLVQAGEYLRKHEPDLWERVKGDWSEIFPKTKVQVKADIKIRRIGVTQ